MSVVINGILTRKLPWGLVLLGVFLVIGVELLGIRSLSFAVGSYLSIGTTAAMDACIAKARKDHEWEDFSREMLARGGDLRRYYPLSDAARPEYEAWKAKRAGGDPSR